MEPIKSERMEKSEFWGLFKKFVKGHPINEARPCYRLDTWAVLKNFEADLNDPALGMTILDRDKPHFFSRVWAAAKYNPNAIRHRFPALVANILEVANERTGKGERVEKVVFDLAVLDVVRAPKGPSGPCARRNEIEIFEDCHNRLQEVFHYLGKVIVAVGTPTGGGDPVPFLGSEQEALYLVDSGEWSGYVVDEKESRSVQRRFKAMTDNTKVFPWRGGTSALYGVYAPELAMDFVICEDEVTLQFEERYTDAINERESY